MKTVLFKDLEVGYEFTLLGIVYIKKSAKTAHLKNDKKCWDYFSKDDEVKVKDKE